MKTAFAARNGMDQKKKTFYPDYLLEILITAFLVTQGAVLLALLFPESIGRAIDISRPFQPKPEWYFLWLYELIGYFSGAWIAVGTTLLPATAFLALALIPVIDRGNGPSHRMAAAIGSILLIGFVVLTILSALRD
jgi:cytochrome b6-f complex subunit 4